MSSDVPVPAPPEEPQELLAWAARHGVAGRLDDVFIGQDGDAPRGTFLPGRRGELVTFRQLLIEEAPEGARASALEGTLEGAQTVRWRRHTLDLEDEARALLRRMATLIATHRMDRDWLDQHGREPADAAIGAFLERLRIDLRELTASRRGAPRPPGAYEPVRVEVLREPVPMLAHEELALSDLHAGGPANERAAIHLLGWNEGPLRWAVLSRHQTAARAVRLDEQQGALEAMIDFLRDPRASAEHEVLGELLRLAAWRFTLGTLDQRLSRLETSAGPRRSAGAAGTPAGAPVQERIAFRVTVQATGELGVEPVIQKRMRGGSFSRGTRLQWFTLPDRRDLTPADRRVYQAYNDRFARNAPGAAWGTRAITQAQVFGVLRAAIDHPAVFLDTDRAAAAAAGTAAGDDPSQRDGARLDLRQGRLGLRFAAVPDGSLTPHFELLGVTLSVSEVADGLRDGRHLIVLHRAEGHGPQVLLAQLTPEAGAVVETLALTPARFPPEAHDALATRLESLQEAVDIEFPSQWTRSIAPADGRLLARLELLASGALHLRLGVRPVKLGPIFAPGEGPGLVLEGQGRERHGARRDHQRERQTALGLVEKLGLVRQSEGESLEPWCWRVPEGDPALQVVATLKQMGDVDAVADAGLAEQVVVEWADEQRLIALGSVGRADMRMKVADRHDWFALEGGAAVKPERAASARRGAAEEQIVPLADLLAAIREHRRFVRVGTQGFVRIEETLREALARAEGAFFTQRDIIQTSPVAHDSLLGLVEDEAQIQASAAFLALRRRLREVTDVVPRLSPELEARLRPYQKAGVVWLTRLAHWGAGAILADEMGLGKTIQTLAVLSHRAALGPALVVAPTSVVGNWIDEAARFVPALRVRLYRGAEREALLRGLGPGDLVVTSYAIATMDGESLRRQTFASLVLDEAQAVKNATTERAKSLRGLDANWRLGLTGTPIENHLGELWSLLRVISPGLLGSWEQFRARYAVPIEKFGDQERRKGLTALLRPFILRRMKSEVARELPPRTEIVKMVKLSGDEQSLYEELRRATVEELAAKKKDPDRDARDLRFVLLAALTRLRQLCCHPRLVYPRTQAGSAKAAVLLELLAELREGDHKALVFSQFRSFLELLAPRLGQHGFRVLMLDGTTPPEVRERRIAAFQAGEADVFLISLKAGGFGLNLTAADTVIHLDPWWNPAVEDQATARAHRMGQLRPVTAVRLVARGTIEEAVLELHAAKRKLAAAVLEGSDAAGSLDTDELIDLIRRGDRPD